MLFLEQRNYDLAIDNFKASLAGNLNSGMLTVWSNIKMGNAYDAKATVLGRWPRTSVPRPRR
jgi:hypothetical protein